METGTILKKCKTIHLDGAIGILMRDFLSTKQSRRIKPITIEKIESHMSKFNIWLSVNNIFDICYIEEKR
jgi:hypothetical protein